MVDEAHRQPAWVKAEFRAEGIDIKTVATGQQAFRARESVERANARHTAGRLPHPEPE